MNTGGEIVTREAGRCKEQYSGAGLVSAIEEFLLKEIEKVSPRPKIMTWGGGGSYFYEQKIRSGVYRLKSVEYYTVFNTTRNRLSGACLQKRATYGLNNNCKSIPANNVDDIITPEVLTTLFEHKYFEAFCNFRLYETTLYNVKDICKRATTFFTDVPCTTTGISFGDCMFVEEGVTYVCQLYCADEKLMMQHLYRHLEQAARVCPPGVHIFFSSFVKEVQQYPVMNAMLEDEFGSWTPSDVPSENVFLVEKDLIKSML